MNAQDLQVIPLFRELDAATLERLAEVVESRDLSDGDTIFSEGDTGNAVYFIAKGAVKIEKKIDASGIATKTLAVLGTGDFFGEMSLFDGKPRSASTVALGSGRVYRVVREAFEALMESDSAVAAGLLFAIINTCNERIRSLNTKVVVFHEIGKAIGEGQDLQGLLEIILKQLMTATAAESGALLLKQEFSEYLELRSKAGFTLSAGELDEVMAGTGVLGKVLKEREVLLVGDFDEEDVSKNLPRSGLESASMILQPVLADDTPLGMICLGHSGKDRFDLDDVNLCSSVAGQAGQAILNFRHREEEAARSRLDRKYVQF